MRLLLATMLVVQSVSAGPVDPGLHAQRGSTAATANVAGPAVKAFEERIEDWMAFHRKVDATVPSLKETSDPKEIAERERTFAEALIRARKNPTPGEYFPKEFQAVLHSIVKQDFAKRTAAERKAIVVELPKGLTIGINQIYPTTIPLATFPANLLKALPELPPELEYRIVYRHLILRDVPANYIVDMVPNVFPIPTS